MNFITSSFSITNFAIRKQWRSLVHIFLICVLCLATTFANSLSNNASAAREPDSSQIIDRFEIIKNKMAKLRFCYNESCFYRNVTSKIIPPNDQNPHYTAEISAAVERPSASPDLADTTLSMLMIIGNCSRVKSLRMLLTMYLLAIAMKFTVFIIAILSVAI